MKGLLKNIVGAVAPTIGTALGGPMGIGAMQGAQLGSSVGGYF